MAKNKIITSQGNVQFINSKGKTINMHPMHCYAVYEGDTVSFLFIYMKEYSGQAFFASQFEDLEVNGETYDNMDDLKDAINYAFAKAGAQARTEIVDELPEDPFTNTIYLLPKEHGEGYDEYIWNEDEGWQLIGDTDIEFERYLKIEDFNPYSAETKEYIDSVSANTVQNAADIVVLSGAIDTEIATREAADAFISGAVDTLSSDLSNEVSRAISAETALGARIDTVNGRVDAEQLARATADTALSGAIDTEIINRASADTALQSAIDNEISARTAADTALDNKIAAVSGAVDAETARAISAETALNTAINTEASARRNADDSILGKIDAVSGAVDTKVTSEVTGSNGKAVIFNESDGGGAQFIHNDGTESFVGVNDGGANGIAVQIYADKLVGGKWQGAKLDVTNGGMYYTVGSDSFTDRAVAANEIAVKGDISDEASARTAADNALGVRIDTEVVASAEYVSSSTTINFKNISGDVISSIDASDFVVDGMVEDVRIENGNLVIDFNTESGIEDIEIPLTDIFNPANYYDKDAIDGIVSGINDSIADEVSARTDADTALQGAIDTVSGNVETETSRATSAETELQTAIENEVSARTAAISAVEGEISSLDDSLSAYSTSAEVTAEINAAVSGKADSSDVYTKSEVDDAISAATDGMATELWVTEQGYITGVDLSNYATTEYVDASVSGKADSDDVYTKQEADAAISQAIVDASGVTSATVESMIDAAVSGLTERLGEDEEVLGAALNELNGDISALTDSLSGYAESSAVTAEINAAVSGKADTSGMTAYTEVSTFTAHTGNSTIHVTTAQTAAWDAKSDFSGSYNDLTDKPTIPTIPTSNTAFTNDAGYITVDALSGYVETSAIATSITSGSTDSQVPSAKCVYDQFGGLKLVKITQSAYDVLVQGGTVDANTLYIIND